ncbi:MAG TPA: helix-turn-helix domain-containing protein [Marinospirillum sp.]|nr:helix-turn-helix domain-containing protein [Marinospirillum sp.]HKM15838.1 helix-turn-helix domain-containing protein [Marinospirillum sp.]
MLKAYKYRLYPNHEQRVLIEKHFIRQQALADLAGLASV